MHGLECLWEEKWIVHAVLWNARSLILPFFLVHLDFTLIDWDLLLLWNLSKVKIHTYYLHQRNCIWCTAILLAAEKLYLIQSNFIYTEKLIWCRAILFDAYKLYLTQRNFILWKETLFAAGLFIKFSGLLGHGKIHNLKIILCDIFTSSRSTSNFPTKQRQN